VIARLFQDFRHRHHTVVQVTFIAGFPFLHRPGEFIHITKARNMVIAAAEQHRAGRRAGGAYVKMGRADSTAGERVDVGCFDLAAEAAHIRIAHVIGDDEKDVGFLVLCLDRGNDEQQ